MEARPEVGGMKLAKNAHCGCLAAPFARGTHDLPLTDLEVEIADCGLACVFFS